MHKGQIFSIDFIIAIGIGILLFGTIILAAEKQNFITIEKSQKDIMTIKQNYAIISILTDPEYNCFIDNNKLTYTLDINKITSLKGQLKQKIGLMDYNVDLSITDDFNLLLINDRLSGENIFVKDFNIVTCNNSNNLYAQNYFDCREGNCYRNNLKERILHIKVSK